MHRPLWFLSMPAGVLSGWQPSGLLPRLPFPWPPTIHRTHNTHAAAWLGPRAGGPAAGGGPRAFLPLRPRAPVPACL